MFNQYLGTRQGEAYGDPLTRQGFALWLERVLAYYGDDSRQVDLAIIDGMLPLTAETAPFIYSEFTPTTASYRQGSRPLLEAVVRSVVKPGMSEREKALALLRRCRDNPKHSGLPDPWIFNGGSEEELIKRGAIMCNEISRVFACLAQIAGLPARVYSSHITGHMMNEVYVEGHWWWVDVMFGLYCFNDNGSPASAWDLFRDPALFHRQKRATFADHYDQGREKFPVHPRAKELNIALRVARYRHCYFNPREAAAIGNHYVSDYESFTYPWRLRSADPAREADARHKLAIVTRRLEWPEWYWDGILFDQTLPTVD